jgi:hypothetical protein
MTAETPTLQPGLRMPSRREGANLPDAPGKPYRPAPWQKGPIQKEPRQKGHSTGARRNGDAQVALRDDSLPRSL